MQTVDQNFIFSRWVEQRWIISTSLCISCIGPFLREWALCLILDVFFLKVGIIVSLDAGASDQNEEETKATEQAAHQIAPETIVTNEEHRGEEEIEVALSLNRLQELKLVHHEREVAEWDDQKYTEQAVNKYKKVSHPQKEKGKIFAQEEQRYLHLVNSESDD